MNETTACGVQYLQALRFTSFTIYSLERIS